MKKNIQNQKYKFYFDWTNPTSGIFLAVDKIYISTRTEYQEVEVLEFSDFGKALVIDGKIQAAVKDEFIYHECLVHIPMISHPNPQKVLVIGGGDGGAIREVLKYPIKKCVIVDIDDTVIEISKKYLEEIHCGAFFDPRLEVIIYDGRKYVEEKHESFDIVIIDVTDPLEGSPSIPLFSVEFLEKVKEICSGIVSIQSNSINPDGSEFLLSMIKTCEVVFKKVSMGSAFVPSFGLLWAFTYSSDNFSPEELSKEEVKKRISERIKENTRYIDEDIFFAVISKPKFIKEKLKSWKRIIRDSEPFTVF